MDGTLEKGYLETSNYVHGREVPFYFLVRSTEQIYALARIATSERRGIRKISRVTDWNARRCRFYDLNLRVCETIDGNRMLLVDRFERRSEARIYPSKRGSSNSSDLVKSLTFPLFLDYNRNFRLVRSMAESHYWNIKRKIDFPPVFPLFLRNNIRKFHLEQIKLDMEGLSKFTDRFGSISKQLNLKVPRETSSGGGGGGRKRNGKAGAFSLIHVNVLDVAETKVSQWRNENTFRDTR
ncbi:hypothetical protein V1477_000259 [Vespula maculifrons]|uniref:Uncharacterized protein n=1 Tax=Vespula maculifrons TaxID=7453 RepID=A0ABD2D151_VESMC